MSTVLERLKTSLLAAASERDLKAWVEQSTGKDFAIYAPSGVAKPHQLEELVTNLLKQEADEPGTLELFLLEAFRNRPLRRDLRQQIADIRPRIREFARIDNARVTIIDDNGTAALASASLGADFHKLVAQQSLANPAIPMVPGVIWAKRFYENLCRVCQIEVNQEAKGTGFLVGSSAVLTNWHVVEAATSGAQVRCRFDYAVGLGGEASPGTVVGLGEGGILVKSDYWPQEKEGEKSPEGPPPEYLDFALLHIDRNKLLRPDDPDLPTAEQRGFVRLKANPVMPQRGHPLIILQHPQAQPVQAALDTAGAMGWELRDPAGALFWTDDRRTRYRYRTNTMGGSSGSPCFSMDWTLVALHHMGHEGWANQNAVNQGIPAGLIYKDIFDRGFGGYLT